MTQTNQKHQAFARAYRPQIFSEVVGQQHVLQALSYSLDQQNLHHAYLLTGTRGVGKTTLGRIFAKALNCEQGISSSPCGTCSACESIAGGRFVDLIEVDGASNTKVEDTRELLEDVQFVPTQGRYKIYLIDEVHMLSTHSFNALLKTLEEPPEHVKFILATTDPQKLPITVLSRCLQFHLQLLPIPLIQNHLKSILNQESIAFDDRALYLLADAAQGSMRDALTLADQARSQGQGQIQTDTVTKMLGILDQRLAHQLLHQVLSGSVKSIFETFQHVESTGADSDQILKDLIELTHQVATAQALGPADTQALLGDPSLCESVLELAANSSAAQIQLCFETLLGARKTLAYASSPSTAVRMALLRMACFQSFNSDQVTNNGVDQETVATTAPENSIEKKNNNEPNAPIRPKPVAQRPIAHHVVESQFEPKPSHSHEPHTQNESIQAPEPYQAPTPIDNSAISSAAPATQEAKPSQSLESLTEAKAWFTWVKAHSPGGLFGQLLYNCRLTKIQQNNPGWNVHIIVSKTIFSYDPNNTSQQMSKLLQQAFGEEFQVSTSLEEQIESPPSQLRIQEQEQQRAAYIERVEQSPFVTQLNQQMAVSLQLETEN